MVINSPEAFAAALPPGFDGVFDWDFLFPAFAPTKIRPMDLDCLIERKGNFLVFETKDGDVPIPQGQEITLRTLAMTGLFFVVVLRSKTADGVDGWDLWYRKKSEGTFAQKHFEGDADELVSFVRRWFRWASGEAA